jgi:hypothetical protein
MIRDDVSDVQLEESHRGRKCSTGQAVCQVHITTSPHLTQKGGEETIFSLYWLLLSVTGPSHRDAYSMPHELYCTVPCMG